MLKKIFTTLFVWLLALPLTTNEMMEDEAVQLLQKYLQIDTISPPGNESRAVEFLARIFEKEGIEYDSAESAPGRGNIWARLEGGDKPALILLHHSDVVPANEEYWDFDPLSGDIVDGYIQGTLYIAINDISRERIKIPILFIGRDYIRMMQKN